MPRDKQKPASKKPEPVKGTSAKQRRHDHAIHKAQETRDAAIRDGKPTVHFAAISRQDKIDKKRDTRHRMKGYTPAVRAEHSAAGREHRKPTK